MITISVIIPALNEEIRIAECLSAIVNGTEKPCEIIVADGSSTDRTVEIAKSFGATVVNNEKVHAASGRNFGAAHASGDILAFIDADCKPAIDWVESIRLAFESEDIDGIRGRIEPIESDNIYEIFWGNVWLKEVMKFDEKPFYVSARMLTQALITANCAYRRSLFNKLGGFSDWFANNAEDVDFAYRAFNSGAKLKYVPSVRVWAHSPTTMKGIKKKSFRDGISSSKLQKVYGESLHCDSAIYKMLFKNIIPAIKGDKNSQTMFFELLWHLFGKYYGSFKVGTINL